MIRKLIIFISVLLSFLVVNGGTLTFNDGDVLRADNVPVCMADGTSSLSGDWNLTNMTINNRKFTDEPYKLIYICDTPHANTTIYWRGTEREVINYPNASSYFLSGDFPFFLPRYYDVAVCSQVFNEDLIKPPHMSAWGLNYENLNYDQGQGFTIWGWDISDPSKQIFNGSVINEGGDVEFRAITGLRNNSKDDEGGIFYSYGSMGNTRYTRIACGKNQNETNAGCIVAYGNHLIVPNNLDIGNNVVSSFGLLFKAGAGMYVDYNYPGSSYINGSTAGILFNFQQSTNPYFDSQTGFSATYGNILDMNVGAPPYDNGLNSYRYPIGFDRPPISSNYRYPGNDVGYSFYDSVNNRYASIVYNVAGSGNAYVDFYGEPLNKNPSTSETNRMLFRIGRGGEYAKEYEFVGNGTDYIWKAYSDGAVDSFSVYARQPTMQKYGGTNTISSNSITVEEGIYELIPETSNTDILDSFTLGSGYTADRTGTGEVCFIVMSNDASYNITIQENQTNNFYLDKTKGSFNLDSTRDTFEVCYQSHNGIWLERSRLDAN